jgi:hypothetical protein
MKNKRKFIEPNYLAIYTRTYDILKLLKALIQLEKIINKKQQHLY